MHYKLICIDMDGTLLSSEKEISEFTKKTLLEAYNDGIHIAISTGRNFADVGYYSDLIGINAPVITANGAYIQQKGENEIIYKGILGQVRCKKILDICLKYDVSPCFHTHEKQFYGREFYEYVLGEINIPLEILKKIETQRIVVDTKEQWEIIIQEERKNIVKGILMDTDEAAIQKIRLEVEEMNEFEVTSSVGTDFTWANIELTRKGTSKGKGVEILAEYYNLKKEEVMAIGDSENDLSMIDTAGFSVAMGNAIDIVKQRADYITDTNDEDGVAKAIQKFVLSDRLESCLR